MSDNPSKIISYDILLNEPGASANLKDYKDNTNPEYIGPGEWNIIHKRAYDARDHNSQLEYIDFMIKTCKSFPCPVCKEHCTDHINNHPLNDYLDILVDVGNEKLYLGMFVWSWKFHNSVNKRLGKPIMSWITAYNLYSDNENLVCSKTCHNANSSTDKNLIDINLKEKDKKVIPGVPVINDSTNTPSILTSHPVFKFRTIGLSDNNHKIMPVIEGNNFKFIKNKNNKGVK